MKLARLVSLPSALILIHYTFTLFNIHYDKQTPFTAPKDQKQQTRPKTHPERYLSLRDALR